MALFDDASLVVTPNGYKEGTLYSIKPTSGLGDMTVVRATTATRVNSAGLIELVPYNLLTYSEQFDNAAWTKSGVTVTANTTISPDGTQNATSLTNTTTGQSHIRTSFVVASTGNYTGTSYIKKQDFDFIYVEFGNAYAWFNISNGTLGNSGNFGLKPISQRTWN